MLRNSLNERRIPGWVRELAPDRVPKPGSPAHGLLPAARQRQPGDCGERLCARQVAPQTRGPGPPGASPGAVLGHAAPLPSAGAAQPVRLRLHRAPRARLGLASRPVHQAAARPAAVSTMTLPRGRAGARALASAAKVAQRRRLVEDAGRSPSPATWSRRAALYVHVSGKEGPSSRGGARRREPIWRLVSREPTGRPSPLPGEVLGGSRCPGWEMSEVPGAHQLGDP